MNMESEAPVLHTQYAPDRDSEGNLAVVRYTFWRYIDNSTMGAGLRRALRAAHIQIPHRQYLRQACLATFCAFIAYCIFLTALSLGGYRITLLWVIPDVMARMIFFVIAVPGTFLLLYMYPFLVAQGRATQIDQDLPYAITYMQALSTTMTLYEVIRRVYEESDLFGEVSREFGLIIRDVEVFGDDLYTAVRNLQGITPSAKLADFLNDLILLSDSGGSITGFLAARSDVFRDAAKREMEMSLKTIEIMAEVYVTAFVAGPIVVLVMLLAQDMSGKAAMAEWMPVIFFGIPIGALTMIALLYILLPGEKISVSRKETRERESIGVIPQDPHMEAGEADPGVFSSTLRTIRFRKKFRHPWRTYISDYRWGAGIGIVLALFVYLLWEWGIIGRYFPAYTPEVAITILAAALMLPVAIAFEGRNWFVRHIERQMPEFLREIADMKDIGMTLQGAINRISRIKLGVLSDELTMVSEELRRGMSISHALVRMEERIGLASVKRAISLVVRASEVTEHIREVLMIAISDFEYYLKMKSERFNSAFTYVVIVYLSFAVFLYTVYQLNVNFVISFTGFDTAIDVASNVTDMFHIAIVLGAVSGIMAGQFSSGSILAGFKHSIIFLIGTVFLFTQIIGGQVMA
ncbi:MAG: type II secretion system F family protein [Methanomicrobiales archaeon]